MAETILQKRKRAFEILRRLKKRLRGRPFLGTTIGKYTPFQVLISTMISQRTRDENTDVASTKLFSRFKTPEQVAGASAKEIEKLIHASGFYRQKAGRIKEVSAILVRDFNSTVPKSKEQLMSLPGVGPKTAGCVLVYGFNLPAIPVDTHVHRISNRLGLAKTREPEKTEAVLEQLFEKKDWVAVNDLFVRFGQTTCKPIGPLCAQCPLNGICPYYRRQSRKF